MPTAHVDSFARDHLPPPEAQPRFLFERPELQFPEQLNCAVPLLEQHVAQGRGGRAAIRAPGVAWTYAELNERANRIAEVLVNEMGLVPGNRVLLRAPNTPMLAACWFGVIKAGAIAVATMPMLRARELQPIIAKARVTHALCDARLLDELLAAKGQGPWLGQCLSCSADGASGELEDAMARQSGSFSAVATAADDTCLLAFTSGTTGVPKATMHFHRDLMAACECFPRHVLKPRADDVFIGSPPLAFTFGLGGLLLFPLHVGACAVLLEQAGPAQLADAIARFGATTLFTSPTAYRVLAAQGEALKATALRQCVSAGEVLPAATRTLWRSATGIELIDGIGATEMLHIFISADESQARAGATGKAVAGYRAKVVDAQGQEVPVGTVGRLAVQGPTGCRYLDDVRQAQYVQGGWNLTGDAYSMDADGYFHYQARTDDMIVSSGYNIAAPEVEDALMGHAAVAECAVVGQPDQARGCIVKAFVVLRPGQQAGEALVSALQDHVKQTIAPYKYPRAIEFVDALPRTSTGKLQRFALRAPAAADTATSSATPGATHSAPSGARP